MKNKKTKNISKTTIRYKLHLLWKKWKEVWN